MIRRIIRWLRAVFPYWSVLVITVLGVQAWISIEAAWHGKDPLRRPDHAALGYILTFGYAVLYAAYRVFGMHPLWQKSYSDWLAATPWTGRKRLPMGTVALIPQDVLMVALHIGLAWWWGKELGAHLPLFVGAMLGVAAGVYLFLLAVTLRFCDEWRGAYAVWFGMGACVSSIGHWWLFWSLALLTYLCALAGLKASWRGFPWPVEKLHRTLKMIADASKGQTVISAIALDTLGWPFDWLSPKPEREAFTPGQDVLLGSLLFGWWYNCIAAHAEGHPQVVEIQMFVAGLFVGFLLLLSIGRLADYLKGLSAQLSLTARLVTWRWIVPRWDVVWVPMWLLLMLNSSLFSLGLNNGAIRGVLPWWQFRLATSALLAFGMWTQLGNAPPFRKWRLTGNFRMNPDSLTVKQQKSQWVQCN